MYILDFNSNNINIKKESYINDLKLKSFNSIMQNLLTFNNFNKIQKKINLNFVNNFILNININNEKIVNNNYYSEIKINFNKNLIIEFLNLNKINYIDYFPENFLIIILDENKYEKYLLSKKNVFYDYLIKSKKNTFDFFLPNLDFNDRYIFNENEYKKNKFKNIINLGIKYKKNNIIFVHSEINNNENQITTYLINGSNSYFLYKKNYTTKNFNNIFLDIKIFSLDKWKEINNVENNIVSTLKCTLKINNVYELRYVNNLLESSNIIKNFILNFISFSSNEYIISYYGSLQILKKSLKKIRLNLDIESENCIMRLI